MMIRGIAVPDTDPTFLTLMDELLTEEEVARDGVHSRWRSAITAGLRGRQSGVEKRMHTPNAFLKRLSAQTGGRTDRTVRAYLHVAKPLGLTLAEMRVTVGDLITRDLVEVDPGFDRLIRLTVAAQERMIAWQERAAPSGAVRH